VLRCEDREAYTLSAALSLGLVTLASGRGKAHEAAARGSPTLLLEQRLHHFIAGGRLAQAAAGSSESTGGGGSGLAAAVLGGASVFDPQVARSSKVSDGEFINTNVTAPGATLALALAFLKSNDASVAARLALPDTHPLLDTVRPDLLMLRVVARSLVLWDGVRASTEWVMDQASSSPGGARA
jgi:anaphase-promoting complex subunit 1